MLRGGCRPTVEIGEDFLRSFLDLSHINESPEAVQDDFLNSFQNK